MSARVPSRSVRNAEPAAVRPSAARGALRGLALCALLGAALLGAARGAAAASPARDPALLACDAQRDRGRAEAARACYRALLTAKAPPALAAEAHWALGERREANDAFRKALAAAPQSAELRTRWGLLYLDTYQPDEAQALFQEVLARDPADAGARLGLARALLDEEPARAAELAEAVAKDAPGSPEAPLLLARMSLDAARLERAADWLERVPAGAPEDCSAQQLELYALHASLDALRERADSPWTARALACNPHYGAIHATPAEFLGSIRRYRQAAALLEKSVAIEPDLWSAHAELAVNLLRENRVEEARRHLEIAYRGDPFRPQTVNTLRLLDELARFHTSVYAAGDGKPGLELRLQEKEWRVLDPYARELAGRAAEVFSRKYGFAAQRPIVIEMYPNHDDFAVRTAGIPGLGILGATFGYVVAMDSPTSRRPDEGFFWGSVLWHELAHVFTLEATDHRVPRWFSEGVSVYEEWASGPAPQRFLPESFLDALRRGRLLPLAELDEGFIRPTEPGQVAISYLQAGLFCEYVAGEWGEDRLRALLGAFGRGLGTSAALSEIFERPPEQLDRGFLEFVRKRAGARLDGVEWAQARSAAEAALAAGDPGAAARSAERALALEPDDVGEDSAYLLLAKAHEARGEADAALAQLSAYHLHGGRAAEPLTRLAIGLEQRRRRREAIDVLADLRYVEPMSEELHERLGEWLLAEGRAAQAGDEFRAGLALEPHDPSAAGYGLARAYRDLGQAQQARLQVLEVLERTPRHRPAQRLLLELHRSKDPGVGAGRRPR